MNVSIILMSPFRSLLVLCQSLAVAVGLILVSVPSVTKHLISAAVDRILRTYMRKEAPSQARRRRSPLAAAAAAAAGCSWGRSLQRPHNLDTQRTLAHGAVCLAVQILSCFLQRGFRRRGSAVCC